MKKRYNVLGHRVIIRSVEKNKYDESNPIITLDCRQHCCTIPYGLIITSTLRDARKLIKKEKVDSVIFTKKQINFIDHLAAEFYSYFEVGDVDVEEIGDIRNTIRSHRLS